MLIKDSFPLTHLFLCYQTLKNMKNYLYITFSFKTNKALRILGLHLIFWSLLVYLYVAEETLLSSMNISCMSNCSYP